MAVWLTEPREFTREELERLVRLAEEMPDDDPDKAEAVAARKEDLRFHFGPKRPRRSREERVAALKSFSDDDDK